MQTAPAFSGIDFSQYGGWPTVSTRTGQVYYKVPGTPGFVFSPYDNKIYDDPTIAQKIVDEEKKKIKDQSLGPYEQIGILGLGAGTAKLAENIADKGIGGTISDVKGLLGFGGSSSAPATATQGAEQLFTKVGPNEYGSEASSFAREAAPVLGAVGAGLGAYNAYKGIESGNPIQAGLGGLGAVTGINAMGYTLGPYGVAASIAIPILGSLFNRKPQTEVEEKRLKKLIGSGIKTFSDGSIKESRGRSQQLADAKKELGVGDDFTGFTKDGQWVNTKWLKSGKESDLKAQDIWGYSAFSETFGNDWYNTSEANREKIASKALDLGVIREHHGTIDLTGKNKEEFLKYANSVLGGQDSKEEDVTSKWSIRPGQEEVSTNKVVSPSPSANTQTNSNNTGQNLKPTAPLPDGQTAFAKTAITVDRKDDPRLPMVKSMLRGR